MTRYSPRVVAGLRWHGRESFNVLRYAYCHDEEAWATLRAHVLRDCHVDVGDFPDTTGNVTSWIDGAGAGRHVVTVKYSEIENEAHLCGVIAHEAWHVTQAVFDAMKEHEPGEETIAYTLGAIVNILHLEVSEARGREKEAAS